MHVEKEMKAQGVKPNEVLLDEAIGTDSKIVEKIPAKEAEDDNFIVRGRITLVIESDKKVKKQAYRLTEQRLNKAGLRKYFDIDNEKYKGNPNDSKKLLIANILREAIEEVVAKRKILLQNAKRMSTNG